MTRVRIHVTLKASVLDPQGSAVATSLRTLGFDEVEDVRVGKLVELTLDTDDRDEAAARVHAMCERLLANPVIECYEFEFEPALAGVA